MNRNFSLDQTKQRPWCDHAPDPHDQLETKIWAFFCVSVFSYPCQLTACQHQLCVVVLGLLLLLLLGWRCWRSRRNGGMGHLRALLALSLQEKTKGKFPFSRLFKLRTHTHTHTHRSWSCTAIVIYYHWQSDSLDCCQRFSTLKVGVYEKWHWTCTKPESC